MGRGWGSEKVVSKKKRCLRWTLEDRSDFHRESSAGSSGRREGRLAKPCALGTKTSGCPCRTVPTGAMVMATVACRRRGLLAHSAQP